MTSHNVFFWSTSAFSGSGQLNEGPFHVGSVNRLLRAEVRGQINAQGQSISDTSVIGNYAAFGLQWGAHGFVPNDVISGTDDDTWLIRRQLGTDDYISTWAPTTDTAAVLVGYTVTDDWRGQLVVGEDTDVYLLIKASTGVSLANFNTFGTIRLWWT